ncbi:MAG: hypothetical protein MR008_04495 [Aerococcus sp.]|nr:hypothetical protein [Aerococcus sp.]
MNSKVLKRQQFNDEIQGINNRVNSLENLKEALNRFSNIDFAHLPFEDEEVSNNVKGFFIDIADIIEDTQDRLSDTAIFLQNTKLILELENYFDETFQFTVIRNNDGDDE